MPAEIVPGEIMPEKTDGPLSVPRARMDR